MLHKRVTNIVEALVRCVEAEYNIKLAIEQYLYLNAKNNSIKGIR